LRCGGFRAEMAEATDNFLYQGEAEMDAFTLFHTLLSLIELVSGIVVVVALLGSRVSTLWTGVFFVSAVLTDVTGFGFKAPFPLPSQIVGILSLIALAVAILGLYKYHLAGAWRWIYAVCVAIAVYFDTFVAVAQLFMKVPVFKALAPTQSEPPFAVVQIIVLLIFVWLIYSAVKKFRPGMSAAH
jgi:hypothetical protein